MSIEKFTQKGQFHKILESLKGMLSGMAIDGDINTVEFREIANWCKTHSPLRKKIPFSEIIPTIETAMEDNFIDSEEIANIIWLCDKYLQQNKYYDAITTDIQNLHGLLHGLLSDNRLNRVELSNLQQWLFDTSHLSGTYPYAELDTILPGILKDGQISPEESNMLKAFFSEFAAPLAPTTINQAELAEIRNSTKLTGVCATAPEITFSGKIFCLTGKPTKGQKEDLKKQILALNAEYSESVSSKVDYLIVGGNGNPCWAYSCYGRKVEQAMNLRKSGKPILIVHETDFHDAIQDVRS